MHSHDVAPVLPLLSLSPARACRSRIRVVAALSAIMLAFTSACGGATTDRGGSITQPPIGTSPAPGSPQSPLPPAEPRWDPASPLPALIEANYIDVSRIAAVSRFRSSIGHDYSDDYERCRSMKHYFLPRGNGADWDSIRIVAPVSGRVERVIQEWAGSQLHIRSRAHPAFTVILFHVTLDGAWAVGDSVSAGQHLGMHIGKQTMSDVAVLAATSGGRAYVSYMQALPAVLLEPFAQRTSAGAAAFVIARGERDASPMTCLGETFLGTDTLSQWVSLGVER